jgi:branched-subunit amino acid ABC-type transport system permease component
MDLEKDDFRTVIEDARTRHGALVTLIYATDQQATALLRLCSTIAVAVASGALAGLTNSGVISRPLGYALAAATAVLTLGAALCLKTLQASIISLPGRTPDFWQWAMHPDVDRRAVLIAYLDNLKDKRSINSDLNIKAAAALKWAKYCVAAAAPLALLTGLVAFRFGF